MHNADIAALYDIRDLNAGFLVIKPSSRTRQLYKIIRQLTSSRRMDDQTALNKAVRMVKIHQKYEKVLRVKALDSNRFMDGRDYFEKPGVMYPKLFDSCKLKSKSTCPLVVHNNWIVGKEAKIYRFREYLMWLYDGNDQYYSSETRKYLTYTNPTPETSARNVTECEISALKTALVIGGLLDRVVVLPKFHCGAPYLQCPLNSIIHITTFDKKFSGRYRESSFLNHPKVPYSVKQGETDCRFVLYPHHESNARLSGSDVLRLFSGLSSKVLHLGNLQQVKVGLENTTANSQFKSNLQVAFRRSCQRQHHCSVYNDDVIAWFQ